MAECRIENITDEVAKVAKDAIYVTVGFGVMAAQKANQAVKDLQERVDAGLESGKGTWNDQWKSLSETLTSIEDKVETTLDDVQGRLPEQAKDLMGKARVSVKDAREQVRSRIVRPEDTAAA
jgi:chaperonin cofactor prefoldin